MPLILELKTLYLSSSVSHFSVFLQKILQKIKLIITKDKSTFCYLICLVNWCLLFKNLHILKSFNQKQSCNIYLGNICDTIHGILLHFFSKTLHWKNKKIKTLFRSVTSQISQIRMAPLSLYCFPIALLLKYVYA